MQLYVVSRTFEDGRRFCIGQGIHPFAVSLASTDANFFVPNYTPEQEDWVVRYGPWQEGRNKNVIWQIFEQANPVVVDAFMVDEQIDWPLEIKQRYGLT